MNPSPPPPPPPTPPSEMDRLSDLPEPLLLLILSFLPVNLSACTSLLSRRFRHLWSLTPSLDLDILALPRTKNRLARFLAMADRCLVGRDPSAPPLLRLRLHLRSIDNYSLPLQSVQSWLTHVDNHGLRHLSLDLPHETLASLLPIILLRFQSLESLSITCSKSGDYTSLLPPTINLTHLKTLHLDQSLQLESGDLTRLIKELPSLETLSLKYVGLANIDLTSETVTRLKMSCMRANEVRLIFPKLEHLELCCVAGTLERFRGQMPRLWKARVCFSDVVEADILAVSDLLRIIANAEELLLFIEEHGNELYPFHPLLEPGRGPPSFQNLKTFILNICFSKETIEDLFILLQNSPMLETLLLFNLAPRIFNDSKKRKHWRSKLPRNLDGNYQWGFFKDLRKEDKRTELVKMLTKKIKK